MYNVTSIKEANAIIGALEDIKNAMEGGYPEPTSATDGQVLTADGDGGASWEDAQGGLPSTEGASEGDVLTVDSNGDPAWETPSGGLPAITSSDNGKVLTAVYDDKGGSGYSEWQTPTGGSEVGHYNINIADLSYNDKSGNYFGSISIPIGKNIIACNAVAVSSPSRTQCPISQFTIEHDGITIWEIINIPSAVYSEISQDYVYIDIIYA